MLCGKDEATTTRTTRESGKIHHVYDIEDGRSLVQYAHGPPRQPPPKRLDSLITYCS